MKKGEGMRSPDQDEFRNRRAGLVFFGLIQTGLGVILGLVAVFMALLATVPAPAGEQARAVTPEAYGLFFGGLALPPAVIFVGMGIGSILARRWARAISLVVGWLWLAFGATSLVGLVLYVPALMEGLGEASRDSQVSQAQLTMIGNVVKTIMIVFDLVFMLLLPAGLVLFYGSRHVKATCEVLDPKERWTDRVPLPVLALILLLGFGALQCVAGALVPFRMLPFFGRMVHGPPAGILLMALGVALAVLARGVYRLDTRAWAATVGLWIVGWISSILTWTGLEPAELVEAMGLPEGGGEALPAYLTEGSTMLLFTCAGGVAWLGFLLYLKRYFPERGVPDPTAQP
jgi:hypothetical protein